MKVLSFRPSDYYGTPEEEVFWEDNWLSNAMAWVSVKLGLALLCSGEQKFMSKIINYLWTDCTCCLVLRYVGVGILIGLIF